MSAADASGARGAREGARPLAVAAAIVLLAAVLRFWAIDLGLPNQRARPDELPVVLEMARPARGEFALEMSIYPNAYVYASWLWIEAGLRVSPLFGVEPPGGYQKTLLVRPELLFLLGRTASAFAGTLAVALAIGLARRELGWAAALAAGLLAAGSFLHVRDSHALKPDALLSAATVAALAAMMPLARRATPARAAAAGAVVGLAMAAKLTGVLMLAPLWVAACLGARDRGLRRVVSIPAVAGSAAALAVFAATSPHMVFGGEIQHEALYVLQMIFPGIFGEVAPSAAVAPGLEGFRPPEALGLARYGEGAWWRTFAYHVDFSLWYGVGALGTLLAPVAVAWGFATRRPLPVLAAVTCLVHYVVVSLSPALTSRYMTSFMPVLAILEGGALAAFARRVAPRRAGVVLAVLACAVGAQPFLASVGHDRVASRVDTRVLASRWLAEHAQKGDRVKFLGDVLMPYGRPNPPRGVVAFDAPPEPDALAEAGVDWVVTHEHELYYSSVIPEELARIAPRLELRAEFDPRAEHPERAVFEANDAYYIPVSGFSGVTRPGPWIRIYAFTAPDEPAEATARSDR